MEQKVFYVKTQQGSRTRYVPYNPEIDDVDLTEAQILSMVGALGVTVIAQYERLIPPHKLTARKIKAVKEKILDMYMGTGQELDPVMINYWIDCWNLAAMTISKGAIRL
jgi:sugar-specific transcriptional regulator TrmB